MFFEKWDEFIDSEIGEDFAVPIEGGSLGLAGEGYHFLHGFAVAGDVEGLDFDFFVGEVGDDFVAPWATAFDIEDGKVHECEGWSGEFLFPAAAEGAVGLDDGAETVAAGVGEVEFGGEEATLGVEDFEVAGGSALKAVNGDAGNVFL